VLHHVQHLSSGGGAEVFPVPSGDGLEAENSINFLGQSKQQSADRHLAPLGHLILIQRQPVFDLSL
jgi:hypothetical protein